MFLPVFKPGQSLKIIMIFSLLYIFIHSYIIYKFTNPPSPSPLKKEKKSFYFLKLAPDATSVLLGILLISIQLYFCRALFAKKNIL